MQNTFHIHLIFIICITTHLIPTVSPLHSNINTNTSSSENNLPLVINSLFTDHTSSPEHCLFLLNDKLKVIDLHDMKVGYIEGDKNKFIYICQNNKPNIAIGDQSQIIPAEIEYKNDEFILNYNDSSTIKTYKIICGSSRYIEDNNIIKNIQACGFSFHIREFFYKNNVIAGALVLIVVLIIFYGFDYQKVSISVSLGYIIFVLLEMIFGYIGKNPLKDKISFYFIGLVVIIIVLSPFIGFLINMSPKVTKIYFGTYCGFIIMKYFIMNLIILRFNNFIANSKLIIVICYAIIATIGGIIVCINNKHDTLIIIITCSLVGAFLFIECLDHFVGGMPKEFYMINLAKYGDYNTIRDYLNSGMLYIYLGIYIIVFALGIAHQKWKQIQYIQIKKESQKKPERDVSVQHRSYQLMNRSQD